MVEIRKPELSEIGTPVELARIALEYVIADLELSGELGATDCRRSRLESTLGKLRSARLALSVCDDMLSLAASELRHSEKGRSWAAAFAT